MLSLSTCTVNISRFESVISPMLLYSLITGPFSGLMLLHLIHCLVCRVFLAVKELYQIESHVVVDAGMPHTGDNCGCIADPRHYLEGNLIM